MYKKASEMHWSSTPIRQNLNNICAANCKLGQWEKPDKPAKGITGGSWSSVVKEIWNGQNGLV